MIEEINRLIGTEQNFYRPKVLANVFLAGQHN
jgi:hypothetical protein